jgi:adenylate cyclase
VEIFTPCDDAATCEANAAAIAAERAKRWDEAQAAWRRILALDPDDGIAPVHLARIAAARAAGPNVAWRDAVELEKL